MNTLYAIANREVRQTSKGFRLFETCTSERGTAVSPVFKTIDALCEWAAVNATIFANIKLSAEEWKAKIGGNLPPSVSIL